MKLAFSTLACPQWNLDDVIEAALRHGYDGIDFRGLRGELDVTTLPEFGEDLPHTVEAVRGAGLAVSAMSSGARLLDTDPHAARDEVLRYARLCAAFDTPLIRIFAGRIEGEARESALPRAAQNLRLLAEAARPAMVGIETHDDWTDSSPLIALLDAAGVDNAGIIWDPHHTIHLAGETPQQTWRRLGPHIRCVHVKDGATLDGKRQCVLPGEGDIPWPTIINVLRDGGYDGFLTLEWEKRWQPQIAEPERALPAYADYLRGLLAEG